MKSIMRITHLKAGAALIGLMLFGPLHQAAASAAESRAVVVPLSADGVQRLEITVDSYSFTPDRLIVKENTPVELTLKSVTWIVPHNFVLKSLEAGIDVEQEVPTGGTTAVRFTPRRVGKFKFVCTKKLLFFPSHEDQGMVGILEVRKQP
ncbi:MAG: cupredoxin domain-containing protein [Deltaproteobacteria bacterium]|nr:cupredoxin domain-containing protein [Deltaproteobacteria bacterium]